MAVTFGALKTRIQNETNKPSSANLTFIGDAIVTAIKYYEPQAFWFTDHKDTLTLLSGVNSVALPSDFKAMQNLRIIVNGFYVGRNTGFELVDNAALEDNWPDATLSQTPQEWSKFGSLVYVNCLADQNYSLPITYTRGDTSYPSEDGDTSIWFDEAADLIRYKAMATFYRDKLHGFDEADVFDGKAQEIFNGLRDRNNSADQEYILA